MLLMIICLFLEKASNFVMFIMLFFNLLLCTSKLICIFFMIYSVNYAEISGDCRQKLKYLFFIYLIKICFKIIF